MKKCNLVYKKTICLGPVFERCLEENKYIDCCENHYKIFRLIKLLMEKYGFSFEEIETKETEQELRELMK